MIPPQASGLRELVAAGSRRLRAFYSDGAANWVSRLATNRGGNHVRRRESSLSAPELFHFEMLMLSRSSIVRRIESNIAS